MGARQKAQVAKAIKVVTDSITRPSNVTAYAAKDAVSEVTTDEHFTFTDVPIVGEIVGARITSSAAVATSLDGELYLYVTDVADTADNAAFDPTDAETLTRIGVIDFATANWKVMTSNSGCDVTGLSIFYRATTKVSDRHSLFGQLVAQNAYVPVSAEVFTIDLVIRED